MRWELLAAYVSMHTACALFMLSMSLVVPESQISTQRLIALATLSGIMLSTTYQASKVTAFLGDTQKGSAVCFSIVECPTGSDTGTHCSHLPRQHITQRSGGRSEPICEAAGAPQHVLVHTIPRAYGSTLQSGEPTGKRRTRDLLP